MAKYVEHKSAKNIYLNENETFDKEKYMEELVERLTKVSDEILSYDPKLIQQDRPDLMYMEDSNLLWREISVRQLPEQDMFFLRTLLQRRSEQTQFESMRGIMYGQ